jgi:hypothetical protein
MAWLNKLFQRAAEPADTVIEKNRLRSDRPVCDVVDDTLGRSSTARSFAKNVLDLDVSEGVVVGVLGPWGSGKTSFINLARKEFEQAGVPILDFNPWMFSGAQQLVESFFFEIAAQLQNRPDLADFGRKLEEYGEALSGMAWLPLAGPWIERARQVIRFVARIFQSRRKSVKAHKREIEKSLAKLESPIVVVLDDIDRLSTSEIRDVFRLVRLTASFPNVVYILAFDRARVEGALAEEGIPGREYLEKILQVAFNVPAVPSSVLRQQTLLALDGTLAGIENPGPLDKSTWPDVFEEIVHPLVRSMRDVRRFALAVRGTLVALDGQVALADVFGLECIRVFMPDVFVLLHGSVDGLTTTSNNFGEHHDPPRLKVQVEALMHSCRDKATIAESMVKRLFPAATRHMPRGTSYGSEWEAQWLKDRRVAHRDILLLYLERVPGERLLALYDAERALSHFGDREALDSYLRSIEPSRLRDLIWNLKNLEERFTPEHVVPSTIVLLNLLPELPQQQHGMFDFGPNVSVTRVTYRLLRSLKDPLTIEAAVEKILPELTTLSSKLELIVQVGHHKNAGHKLISEEADHAFRKSWRSQVRAAPTELLLRDWNLYLALFEAKFQAHPSEDDLVIPESPEITLRILQTARSEVTSWTSGSYAVQRFSRLDWDGLIKLFGNEPALRQRVDGIKMSLGNSVDPDLLNLVDKYFNGWRPTEFDED